MNTLSIAVDHDSDSHSDPKQLEYFRIHGFIIPVTPDGRRVWPPKFKKFIIDKIANGNFKLKNIAEQCKVHPSVIQQWRNEIKTYAPDEFRRNERHEPLEVFGYVIHRMNNGRRI